MIFSWGVFFFGTKDVAAYAKCVQIVFGEDMIVELSAEDVVDVGWVSFCAFVGVLLASCCKGIGTSFKGSADTGFCFVMLFFLRAENILVEITVGDWLQVLQFS